MMAPMQVIDRQRVGLIPIFSGLIYMRFLKDSDVLTLKTMVIHTVDVPHVDLSKVDNIKPPVGICPVDDILDLEKIGGKLWYFEHSKDVGYYAHPDKEVLYYGIKGEFPLRWGHPMTWSTKPSVRKRSLQPGHANLRATGASVTREILSSLLAHRPMRETTSSTLSRSEIGQVTPSSNVASRNSRMRADSAIETR